MRLTFDKGTSERERAHAERLVHLYVGRFAPLLSGVSIGKEMNAQNGEATVHVMITLRDGQTLKAKSTAAHADEALERALDRSARSLTAQTDQKRKR